MQSSTLGRRNNKVQLCNDFTSIQAAPLVDVLRECAHPTREEHTKQNKHHLSTAIAQRQSSTILTTSPYTYSNFINYTNYLLTPTILMYYVCNTIVYFCKFFCRGDNSSIAYGVSQPSSRDLTSSI